MEASGKAERTLDEFLVAAARTGDPKAFSLLARRWQRRLIAHAWRLLGDSEEAREAAQEGWIEIARGLHRLAEPRAFPAWAYRIVSRRCAKAVGAARRRRELAEAIQAQPAMEVEASEANASDGERLRAAMTRLPSDQRAAIALFYLEELSVAEVAVALAVPAGTVKTRLMHARRKLRAALEGDE